MTVYDEAHEWYSTHWDAEMPVGDWRRLISESGWGYPFWPADRFGRGLSHAEASEADRARVDVGAFGPPNGVSVTLVAPTLFEHGPDLLLDRYLPKIATGEELWCQLFSEPGAGSDLAGLRTTAERDGDEWIINGQKVWTTAAHTADRAVVMARTDPNVTKHQGISFFCIDMGQPGVEVRPLRDMTGDCEFNEVFMDNARVRHDDAIGGLNNGWRAAMTMLAVERELDAVGHDGGGDVVNDVDLSAPVGVVQHAQATSTGISGFSCTTGAMKDRVVRSLLDDEDRTDPLLRQALANAHIERAVLDWNGARQVNPSLGKLGNSLLCRTLRDLGFSGKGMPAQLGRDDQPDGGHFLKTALFAQGMAIVGGTDEIQRNLIGERELGLPKEPDPTRGLAFSELSNPKEKPMPYTAQQLSDLQHIRDVLHAYCRAIDDNRPDDVEELFTDDCEYDYGGELGTFSDKAYAYKFFRAGTDKIYKRSAHYVSNIEVSFNGEDSAETVTYLDAWHEFHSDIDNACDNAWIFGRYVDSFVRTDAGWRICKRQVLTMGQEAWPARPTTWRATCCRLVAEVRYRSLGWS